MINYRLCIHPIEILAKYGFLCLLVSLANIEKTIAAPDQFFISAGEEIYYQDTSTEQEAIILVHGFGMDSKMWIETGIAEKLSRKYRVVLIDLRGHGLSSKPKNLISYGPKVGEDIINLLSHLEIKKAHVVGYSMGAYVASRLLVSHPSRLLSVTLCSGTFPIEDKAELEFQESTATHMEENGDYVLASVARGWALDSISFNQIEKITIPMQSVFGEQELARYSKDQLAALELPASATTIQIIKGADHDSKKAAVLHPDFLKAVLEFLAHNSN